MAQTLGEQLTEVQNAISKTLQSISYQQGDKQLERERLSSLEKREEKLIQKINQYGSSYIEGQNTKTKKAVYGVSFG